MSELRINSQQGAYCVELLAAPALGELCQRLKARGKNPVVIDRKVARLYESKLAPLLADSPVLLLDATEEEKSWKGVEKVCTFLQKIGASKKTQLTVMGGGIVQDIAALSSHLFYRGISWIFVPTTLLSMSDSCIGAKCGVNFNNYKNQLGAFHSPAHVFLCTEFTETLHDQDLASGFGEIFKLALTGGAELYAEFKSTVSTQGLRGLDLGELILKSLDVKKRVIEIDEYEKDQRRILNYGHTFGHALESLSHYEIPHGLAVAWGMDLVNFIAFKKGVLGKENYLDVHGFYKKHFFVKIPDSVTAVALIEKVKKDKKASTASVNLVLLEKPGNLKIVNTNFDSHFQHLVADYFHSHDL